MYLKPHRQTMWTQIRPPPPPPQQFHHQHHHQNRPVNDYVQNVQHIQRRYTLNDNRNTQTFRRYHQHIKNNRQQERGFTPKSFFKMQDNRQYDVPSLLMPRTHRTGRGRYRTIQSG